MSPTLSDAEFLAEPIRERLHGHGEHLLVSNLDALLSLFIDAKADAERHRFQDDKHTAERDEALRLITAAMSELGRADDVRANRTKIIGNTWLILAGGRE